MQSFAKLPEADFWSACKTVIDQFEAGLEVQKLVAAYIVKITTPNYFDDQGPRSSAPSRTIRPGQGHRRQDHGPQDHGPQEQGRAARLRQNILPGPLRCHPLAQKVIPNDRFLLGFTDLLGVRAYAVRGERSESMWPFPFPGPSEPLQRVSPHPKIAPMAAPGNVAWIPCGQSTAWSSADTANRIR